MANDTPRTRKTQASRSRSTRLTCVNCRNKKIRCDGAQPSCGICNTYQKDCHYDKPPPMTQVVAMAERIKELEQLLEHEGSPSSSRHGRSNTVDHSSQDWTQGDKQVEPSLRTSDIVNESTSAVHIPEGVDGTTSPIQVASSRFRLCDQDASQWEETAIANCATFLNLPPEKIRHLLSTHWTWVHPVFMFVNQSMFLRDAAVGGEYFSPLVLTILCLHSTRFTDHDLAERLSTYAKLLLGQEIHTEPSIPQIQAFLQMSALEIGKGVTSRAWLYSGIAFRVAQDLGLFTIDTQGSIDIEDRRRRQVGQKLAWSCYLWDKSMSLYLGRSPTLVVPPRWLDNVDESLESTWRPYGVSGSSPSSVSTTSYIETCFFNFCKLGVIINDILLNIYGRERTEDAGTFVRSTRNRLEIWYQELPKGLQMGTTPVVCPNIHILIQNLLYRATIILLLRPFRKMDACRAECRAAADVIERSFLALERTFGFSRVTYLMAYCAYIAATVAVQDATDRIAGAQHKVDTFIRVLSALRYTCPGIQRSLDIIAQSRPPSALQLEQTEVRNDDVTFEDMPAFPINVLGFDSSMPFNNSMTFTDLDAYTSQWSEFPQEMLHDGNF